MKRVTVAALGYLMLSWSLAAQSPRSAVGQERAVAVHLNDNQEFRLSLAQLVDHGRRLFEANWTEQDGGGRPLSKGTGAAISDHARPLKGARAYNRISGPDANSCQGCHNLPYGITGGGGDVVSNVFELAERFDFVTFDPADSRITSGTLDERKQPASLQTVGNVRATPALVGAGYIEMVARQIIEDLQRVRDGILPGESKPLASKGISFGTLGRHADGRWDVSRVEGLPEPSLLTSAGSRKPSLLVRPWQQAGHAVSLREVTNESFNRHHGIQTTERFGIDTDPDGDGVANEMTRADVTAVTIFQATLAVPGRVIPDDPEVERAVLRGERGFGQIQCTTCHVPSIPLERRGWIYTEPNPYNLAGNLRVGETRAVQVDLTDTALPQPRLVPLRSDPTVLNVPAYTDFKLHDISDPADLPADPRDSNQPVGSPAFAAGNRKFVTRRLWGAANEPPFFHDGRFTTMRQAILAHAGEAVEQRRAFERMTKDDQDALIEFLKSLQILPPGTKDLVVNERYQGRSWPPAPETAIFSSRARNTSR